MISSGREGRGQGRQVRGGEGRLRDRVADPVREGGAADPEAPEPPQAALPPLRPPHQQGLRRGERHRQRAHQASEDRGFCARLFNQI